MKEIQMEKVLHCADVSGTSCQFVARAQTMDEILPLTVTPELVSAVKARVTEA